MSASIAPDHRIRVLDAFRAIAIVAVMLHHYLSRYAPPTHSPSLYGYGRLYSPWFDLGTMGVQFFFMISGFVILMTLERCTHLVEFWVRRLARIYPAFVAASAITLCIVRAAGPPEMRTSPLDALLGLTFLTPYLPGVRYVDGSYWSLVTEMQFYCVIGVVFTAFRNRFELAWAGFVCSGAILWVVGNHTEWHILHTLARHLFLIESIPYFTAGILFYQLYAGNSRRPWLLGVAALAAYLLVAEPISTLRPLVTAAMVAAFILFLRGRLEWLAVRPLVFLGSVSYSFYLLHQYIGVTLIGHLTDYLPDMPAMFMAAAVCVLLAYLSTRFVEIPAKDAILDWARRRLFPVLATRLPNLIIRPAGSARGASVRPACRK